MYLALIGLVSTSIFNILSSNIINLIQYIASIIMNKNREAFRNKAIKIDITIVAITIIIPIFLLYKNIEINLGITPIFLIMFVLFYYLNNNAHKIFLEKENMQIERDIEEDRKKESGNTRRTALYILILIAVGILLYLVGELLGGVLNNLCSKFGVSQIIIGILLGFITSIPELITFFESQKHYNSQNNNKILGVVEATNNLLTSNTVNLFIIQTVGIILYSIFN